MRILSALLFVAIGCGPVAPSNGTGPAPQPQPDPVADPEPTPDPDPGQTPASTPLGKAQAAVEGFLKALGDGDGAAMMSYCKLPFSLDGDMFDSEDKLRKEFDEAADKIGRRGGVTIKTISAVSDWRAFAGDYKGAETNLTAFAVIATAEGMGDESMRFFVVMDDEPKLVGLKD